MRLVFAMASCLALTAAAAAQSHQDEVKHRGQMVMGFDQDATVHHFILTADGGRIEVTAKAADDAKSIAEIRSHLTHIAVMFAEGDFSAPMLVHAKEPPGVPGMKHAGSAVKYAYEDLPLGARIVMTTAPADAVAAIHEFLRFQIADHKTGDPADVKK